MKSNKKATQRAKKEPPDVYNDDYEEDYQVQIESESGSLARDDLERISMKEKLNEMEAKLLLK